MTACNRRYRLQFLALNLPQVTLASLEPASPFCPITQKLPVRGIKVSSRRNSAPSLGAAPVPSARPPLTGFLFVADDSLIHICAALAAQSARIITNEPLRGSNEPPAVARAPSFPLSPLTALGGGARAQISVATGVMATDSELIPAGGGSSASISGLEHSDAEASFCDPPLHRG